MKNTRPGIITGLCVVMMIGLVVGLLMLPLVWSIFVAQAPWYTPIIVLSYIVGAICTYGFWSMKKWSVILYTVFMVVNQIILLADGSWNIFGLILPGIVIAILFSQYKLME